jgi:single-strand DNA-binding protein
LVECAGRIGVNAWTGQDGDAKATLTFHVNSIKLHGGSKGIVVNVPSTAVASPATLAEATDDLPF